MAKAGAAAGIHPLACDRAAWSHSLRRLRLLEIAGRWEMHVFGGSPLQRPAMSTLAPWRAASAQLTPRAYRGADPRFRIAATADCACREPQRTLCP